MNQEQMEEMFMVITNQRMDAQFRLLNNLLSVAAALIGNISTDIKNSKKPADPTDQKTLEAQIQILDGYKSVVEAEVMCMQTVRSTLLDEGKYFEDGLPVDAPTIELGVKPGNLSMIQDVPGGQLITRTGKCHGTKQTMLFYRAERSKEIDDGNEVCLGYAEVPQGSLAEMLKVPDDNQNVRALFYEDPCLDNPTNVYWIKRSDVLGETSQSSEKSLAEDPVSIQMAMDLIKDAVRVGVLQDNEKHDHVYLSTILSDGSNVWQAYTIREAAASLLQTGSSKMLEEAVNNAKKEGCHDN